MNFQMFKLFLENHELPDVQAVLWNQKSSCQHLLDHGKSKRVPEKTTISVLLTMPKPLTVWITINCGKSSALAG